MAFLPPSPFTNRVIVQNRHNVSNSARGEHGRRPISGFCAAGSGFRLQAQQKVCADKNARQAPQNVSFAFSQSSGIARTIPAKTGQMRSGVTAQPVLPIQKQSVTPEVTEKGMMMRNDAPIEVVFQFVTSQVEEFTQGSRSDFSWMGHRAIAIAVRVSRNGKSVPKKDKV